MSAVRARKQLKLPKDSAKAETPPACAVLPGLRTQPLRGEASLRVAARCMPAVTFATLERITALRSIPGGQPVDWRQVARECDLVNLKARPESPRHLDPLRPYVLVLAAILHVGEGMQWAEIGEHVWVHGAVELDYLYNKRKSATLPDGLGKLEQFLGRYQEALDAEKDRLLQEFAQSDAKLARGIALKLLRAVDAQLDRITPTAEQAEQLGLELEVIEGEKFAQVIDALSREEKIGKILSNASATKERAYRNLRLITQLNPDAPGDAAGRPLPASADELDALEAQLAAEEAALLAEEQRLDAELVDGIGGKDAAATRMD